MLEKFKIIIERLKMEIVPLYYALFDKRTPIIAKAFASITVGYLLSPIDLIPDFIPIIGLLDDFVIVPLLIKFTITLIPIYIINDIKTKIDSKQKLAKKWYFALPIVLIYIIIIILSVMHFKY